MTLATRWLLAAAVPAAAACLLAAVVPGLHLLGEVVAGLAGLAASAALWTTSRSGDPRDRPWRLLALAPLFPVLSLLLAWASHTDSVLHEVVLRWLPTVPGYAVTVVALLGMVERSRLRRACRRTVLELALFGAAALAVMQLLLVGPGNSWSTLSIGEQVVLGAAVVVTAATMAAGLTVLGAVPAHRQRMAAALLGAVVATCAGRGTGTSAALLGALDVVAATRVAVVVGLALLVLARVLESRARTGGRLAVAGRGRAVQVRSVLPHLALVAVVGLVVGPWPWGPGPPGSPSPARCCASRSRPPTAGSPPARSTSAVPGCARTWPTCATCCTRRGRRCSCSTAGCGSAGRPHP